MGNAFLIFPMLQWLAYAVMIFCAWRAYYTGNSLLGRVARWFVALTIFGAVLRLFSYDLLNGAFQLAAAISCWQLSKRSRSSLLERKRDFDGPDHILDSDR